MKHRKFGAAKFHLSTFFCQENSILIFALHGTGNRRCCRKVDLRILILASTGTGYCRGILVLDKWTLPLGTGILDIADGNWLFVLPVDTGTCYWHSVLELDIAAGYWYWTLPLGTGTGYLHCVLYRQWILLMGTGT